MSCQLNPVCTYHMNCRSANYFTISLHEFTNCMTARPSNIFTHLLNCNSPRLPLRRLNDKKKAGSGRRILHSLLVSIQSSATFTPTPADCVSTEGEARADGSARSSAIDRAQRGASVRRRRCEDKIRE